MKPLEKLCYSYRAHEFTSLGAWNAINKLSNLVQPNDVHEVKHFDTFKSVVEMCKASGINFALLYTANVDISMKHLKFTGKIKTGGIFKDGGYFGLNNDDRALVDKMSEEIYLSTKFLSLASEKLHSRSKQELINDMVKGEDKYSRIMASTLRFLKYHNLRGKLQITPKKETISKSPELVFTNVDDDNRDNVDTEPEPELETNKVSKMCGQYRDWTYPYKVKHTWKECPRKKIGTNYGNELDGKGDIILRQLAEFEEAIGDDYDPAITNRFYLSEGL